MIILLLKLQLFQQHQLLNNSIHSNDNENAIAYKSFLNRGGPDAPGTKDIPQGAEGCLKSLTFVITGTTSHFDLFALIFCFYIIGVLPSLERDECKKIIESYGGRVTTAVSGKTDYLLAGRDVGKTKTDKAEKLRVKIISEDDLLEMIRTRSGNNEDNQLQINHQNQLL